MQLLAFRFFASRWSSLRCLKEANLSDFLDCTTLFTVSFSLKESKRLEKMENLDN